MTSGVYFGFVFGGAFTSGGAVGDLDETDGIPLVSCASWPRAEVSGIVLDPPIQNSRLLRETGLDTVCISPHTVTTVTRGRGTVEPWNRSAELCVTAGHVGSGQTVSTLDMRNDRPHKLKKKKKRPRRNDKG